jgi:hypothetical protein
MPDDCRSKANKHYADRQANCRPPPAFAQEQTNRSNPQSYRPKYSRTRHRGRVDVNLDYRHAACGRG